MGVVPERLALALPLPPPPHHQNELPGIQWIMGCKLLPCVLNGKLVCHRITRSKYQRLSRRDEVLGLSTKEDRAIEKYL